METTVAMTSLLGPTGKPIDTFKKAEPPKMGPAFGAWAGRDSIWNELPGGAVLQFDLSQLTLADYRAMRQNPQINMSLTFLIFMIHQIEWKIECEDKRIADEVDVMLREVWTRLIRAMSQAFAFGYAPTVIEYENDVNNRAVKISKFKDLVPEECSVHWKEVQGAVPPGAPAGAIPPKFKIYDGIRQQGYYPIPPEHTLWYPLLMENGDYYGRKLLKAAFAPWYFSILMHLFANRYYERFGEPTPIGRYPTDGEVMIEGVQKSSREAMENIIMNLRNRGAVLLPSERSVVGIGNSARAEYDYDLEYLESQMRGADFERYMARLDEEMSLALFTPMLLFRTAGEGSHNLGVQHLQSWLWMLNALANDMKEYIDRYVLARMVDYNWSPKAPRAHWMPRKLGKENAETLRAVISVLLGGKGVQGAKVDLDEIGAMMGLTLHESQVLQQPTGDTPTTTPDDPNGNDNKPGGPNQNPRQNPTVSSLGEVRATARDISKRFRGQVEKAWREGRFGPDFNPDLGYRSKFTYALNAEGVPADVAQSMTTELYERLNQWVSIVSSLGTAEFDGPSDFMAMFERKMDSELESICAR